MSENLLRSQVDHPVISELQRRVNGEPGQLRLALSIEGGGMRSVISAAMGWALLDAGILPEHFDAVYGTSGGAFNAAYYLASQSAEGTIGYLEDTGKELIDFRRFASGNRPAIDMEHMIHGTVHSKPLDTGTVIASQKLRPLATDVTNPDQRALHAFEPAKTQEELHMQFRATTALPIVGRGRVIVDGRQYLDGGILERIPLATPISHGYDGILVLATKALVSEAPSRRSVTQYQWLNRSASKLPEDFAILALNDPQERFGLNQTLKTMTDKPVEPPFVYVISPEVSDAKVGRFTLDIDKVKAGVEVGRAAVERVFN